MPSNGKSDLVKRALALRLHISTLAGIGEAGAKLIGKTAGGERIIDLLFCSPRGYTSWTRKDIASLMPGENVRTYGTVTMMHTQGPPARFRRRSAWRIVLEDKGAKLEIKYFQADESWIRRTFKVGAKVEVIGKIEEPSRRDTWLVPVIHHPLRVTAQDAASPSNEALKESSKEASKSVAVKVGARDESLIEPIYSLTLGLHRQKRLQAIKTALGLVFEQDEWIDPEYKGRHAWLAWDKALRKLHFPGSNKEAKHARARLAFDELFAGQLFLRILRSNSTEKNGPLCAGDPKASAKLEQHLPFKLTNSQREAINTIQQDLSKEGRMARLLQGDVGSGKTVVILFAALQVAFGQQEQDADNGADNGVDKGADNGANGEANGGGAGRMQTALMAPSEVLARQHYATLSQLAQHVGLKVALITGQLGARERREIQARVESGEVSIVVGTHALISDSTKFARLGLVVVDEQHRFGVHQRMALMRKAGRLNPHLLVVTATPIPRSLLLTYYGDLDATQITEMPRGIKQVSTSVLSSDKEKELTQRIASALAGGAKIFWVCPAIEESEDAQAKESLASVERRHQFLSQHLPSDYPLLVLHGKIKSPEKAKIIDQFTKAKSAVLVATTVIEVGIDIPDANIIVIEDAGRFGLAALHQLRGRVGRAGQVAVCVLLYRNPLGAKARARLDLLRNSNDGFVIAQEDLKLRGGGDILGYEQSGLPAWRFTELEDHWDLLVEAHKHAKSLLKNDPKLTSNRGLAARVLLKLFDHDSGDILEN